MWKKVLLAIAPLIVVLFIAYVALADVITIKTPCGK